MSELQDYSDFQITTSRLLLEAITFDYLEDIYRDFTDNVAQFIPAIPSKNIADSALFIHKSLLDIINKKTVTCVVLEKNTGEFLGCCALQEIDTSIPTFGLWIKESSQGRGYGFELIQALKTWAEQNLDIAGFSYRVDVNNTASNKIALKLGGVPLKEYPENFEDIGKNFVWRIYEIPLANKNPLK
jgi:RimJ/RimL family protein N-acetyltransferase